MSADEFSVETLLATQTHELKNMLGQLTLALDELAAIGCAGGDDLISAARATSRRVSERLVQMLTLYKMRQDRLAVNLEAQSPQDFIEQLAAEANALARGRLDIRTRCDAAPPFWFFDRSLIELALMNALHNALAYARGGIEIGAEERDGCLILSVTDDSPGYPAHILDTPISPQSSSRGGTGLGLYFSQVAARSHENGDQRGELMLSNRSEQGGALFELKLP
jgi:signal transduction histidine kinase